jgi:hypothetical protein
LFIGCDALFKFIEPQNLSSIGVWVRVVMVILYWACCVPHIGGPFWVSWCAGQFNLGVMYKLELSLPPMILPNRDQQDALQGIWICHNCDAHCLARTNDVAMQKVESWKEGNCRTF